MTQRTAALVAALAIWAGAAFSSQGASDAIAAATGSEVVIVGEVHDNPAHHDTQAEFAARLQPKAIVFEMLRPEDGALIAANPGPQAAAKALAWDDRDWPDFALYHQIIAAAPEARVFGAELPREKVRAAFKATAAEVFEGDPVLFGLDQPLPAAQQEAREARQLAAHCDALPAEMLPGMVEAQRLRDAALAQAVMDARAGPGVGPVLVITGNGHADREWGIPALLAQADPALEIYVVQQFEVSAPARTPSNAQLITAAVDRPDPCEAFK